MQRSTQTERAASTFSLAARAAIEKHVPESRSGDAVWHFGPGTVWVRWMRPSGDAFALGLRRHLDWVTGEAALGPRALDPETLPLWTGDDSAATPSTGYRVRLGLLLHDEDRWWPAGSTPEELSQRLEWLVLQLRVKAESHVARHPLKR